MAGPRDSLSQSPALLKDPESSEGSRSPVVYPSSPGMSTEIRGNMTPLPVTFRADAELKAILQALPTRADIEALVGKVEAAHKREMKEIKQDMQSLSSRLTTGEFSLVTLEQRVASLESTHKDQACSAVDLQLRMEEMEDRSRRNNLRLRGLPEATGPSDLLATVTDIFRRVAGDHLPESVEIDRVHRALGPRPSDPTRPRDVICRLHHYIHKEAISSGAWEAGDIEFDGATVKILPDISRPTLHRRALLKPLLDLARRSNATYRWGFPLSVTFLKDQKSFLLRSPESLPALFTFLGTDPIDIPNWLDYLPRAPGRITTSRGQAPQPQRQQRYGRRPRSLSQDEIRET